MTQEKKQALKEQMKSIFIKEHPEEYNSSELDLSNGDDYGVGARIFNNIVGNITPIIFDYMFSAGETYFFCSYWSKKLGRSIIVDDGVSEYWNADDNKNQDSKIIGDEIIDYLVDLVERAEKIEDFIYVSDRGLILEPSIEQRIDEMKQNDAQTGEHPDATDEQYKEWATEEWEANHGDYIKLEEEDKIKKLANYILSLHQDEALDGDATEKLANIFLAELNKLFANN